jgi:hypothetical protein
VDDVGAHGRHRQIAMFSSDQPTRVQTRAIALPGAQ